MDDEELLRIETPFGYFAILRRRNWERHRLKRQELAGQLDSISTTLAEPDIVVEAEDGCHYFYKLGFGTGRTADCLLNVIVREFATDDQSTRTVASAYFTRVLKAGDQIWPKIS